MRSAQRGFSAGAYAARMLRRVLLSCLLAFACAVAQGATTVRLPAGTCAADDTVFFDGFSGPVAVPSDPSAGNGGAVPADGDLAAAAQVPGGASFEYYLHLPTGYTASRSWPLMVVLHGAAGSHAQAITATQAVRANWAGRADAQGFIVVAPVGSSAQGSWVVPPVQPGSLTDYDGFAAILAAVAADYNIERSRVYLWGFSAGGHVAWDLVFNAGTYTTPLNEGNLAGMAVSAGALSQLACNPQVAGWCDSLVAALPRRLPIDVHIGLTDPLLPYARYDRDLLRAYGGGPGGTFGYHEFNGGHTYTTAHLGEAWAALCRYARD